MMGNRKRGTVATSAPEAMRETGGAGGPAETSGLRPSRRHPRRPVRTAISVLLLIVGIALVLYPLVGNLLYDMTAKQAVDAYDASIEGKSQEELDALWDEAVAYNRELGSPQVRDPWSGDRDAPPLDRYWEVLDPDGTGVMGYVEVQSAGIMLPIYHGVSDEVLEKGVGHIETTALPVGGPGAHPVVTAHTGLPDRMLFTNLKLVQLGDVFSVHVLGRELRYAVSSIDIIEPDDTSLLQPVEGEERMTLFTCTPYGVNSHRLLVTGVPTDAEPTPAALPRWVLPLCLSVTVFLILLIIVALIGRRRAKRRLREDGCEDGQVSAAEGMAMPSDADATADLSAAAACVDEERCARDRRWVRVWTVAVVLSALLLIFSIWVSIGALMRAGLLPYFDWGYSLLPW